MTENIKKYYDVLGLTENDSFKEIQKRYFSLMKIYHPDIYHAKNAEEKAKEINEAYFKIIKHLEEMPKPKQKEKDFSIFNNGLTIHPYIWINITDKNKNNINNNGKRYIIINKTEAVISYSIIENRICVTSVVFNKINNTTTKAILYKAINKGFYSQ